MFGIAHEKAIPSRLRVVEWYDRTEDDMPTRDRTDEKMVQLTGDLINKAGEGTRAYGGGGYEGSFVDKCHV